MFQTDLLSIIRSIVYTAKGICHASYVDCLLARLGWNILTSLVNITKITNTYCCVYSVETPDGWTVDLSETCRVLFQNKFEKQCISLAFIIRIYHDAWSSECQI